MFCALAPVATIANKHAATKFSLTGSPSKLERPALSAPLHRPGRFLVVTANQFDA
jgi:hypothetical protein